MEQGQGLNPLLARLVGRLDAVLDEVRPDRVIVQGDTTSALAGALAAFHRSIPVAHVEAGLRTYCAAAPFPEEANRRAIALLADMHFAPTPAAKANLVAERLRAEVFVTGNTGVDALDLALAAIGDDRPAAGSGKKLILTDSGGVQEEAITLGKPVIVLRAATERLEGGAVLAGTDADRIVQAAEAHLDGSVEPAEPSSAYGDGRAAWRIVNALLGRPVEEFVPVASPARDGLRQIG